MDLTTQITKTGLRRGLSKNTLATYSHCVEKFFRICRKNPYELRKQDILEFMDKMIEQNVPGNTLNVQINALKFFYQEVLHRRLTINLPIQKVPRRLPHFLEKEDVIQLLAQITNPKHKLMITLLYGTGMRVSELVHLKVKDFFFLAGYGWVRQGKGKKDRLFIIPEILHEELMEYIKQQNLADEDWLFSSWKSRPQQSYSDQSIRAILNQARRTGNLRQHIHPHMLRHSFATHFIQNGYSPLELQPLLGHSKVETTMIYVHCAALRMLRVKSPLDSLAERKLAYVRASPEIIERSSSPQLL
ncbi:tyrosine-type recombinase/integrase [Candidatus Woesearchaeota archaeon]|nr:tyrosine-type recombinase/integrase [Candidatus Woesearchaeota archaeon]